MLLLTSVAGYEATRHKHDEGEEGTFRKFRENT
jgi:hypothetical protein